MKKQLPSKHIRIFARLTFLIVIMSAPYFLYAGGPGAGGDPGCDPLDPGCPIDGGLSLLIAAGIGIAGKKAYDKRKSQ